MSCFHKMLSRSAWDQYHEATEKLLVSVNRNVLTANIKKTTHKSVITASPVESELVARIRGGNKLSDLRPTSLKLNTIKLLPGLLIHPSDPLSRVPILSCAGFELGFDLPLRFLVEQVRIAQIYEER